MKNRELPPVPTNYDKYLTEDQKWGLESISNFGFELFFIRREEEHIVVVKQDRNIAVLREDGSLDTDSVVYLRKESDNV